MPAHVFRLNIATGRREPWKTISPPDDAGVYTISEFAMTSDGQAYAYSYTRVLSQLYVINGLK